MTCKSLTFPLAILLTVALAACGGDITEPASSTVDTTRQADPAGNPQDAYWANLEALCGQAFEGSVTDGNDSDSAFAGETLVMHVRECAADELKIPFHVGEDRSRTWVLTRTGAGLRLKHDHRLDDGSEDEVTQYGGDTIDGGSATRQDFYADTFTAELLPAAATNIWAMEIEPGNYFAYSLRREEEGRYFRVEFDLTTPVEAPPAPWGHE